MVVLVCNGSQMNENRLVSTNNLNIYKNQALIYWLELDYAINYSVPSTNSKTCPDYITSDSYDISTCRKFNLTNVQSKHLSRYISKYANIKSKFAEYQSIFIKKMNSASNIDDIFDIFVYIATLRSGTAIQGNIARFNIKSFVDIRQIQILPYTNAGGKFTINEFMQAFVSGITYVGIPPGFTIFDSYLGSPIEFVYHDIAHIKTMESTIFTFDYNSKISSINDWYTYITSGNTRSITENKILLFVTYWLIHESTTFFKTCTFYSDNSEMVNCLSVEVEKFNKNNLTSLRPVYVSNFIDIDYDIDFTSCVNYLYLVYSTKNYGTVSQFR